MASILALNYLLSLGLKLVKFKNQFSYYLKVLRRGIITMANLGNLFGDAFGRGDNNYREAQAASAISKEIASYLGRNKLIDSDGFYVSDKVQGAFPFDLSSFSPLAIRRILWLVLRSPISTRVSSKYSSSKELSVLL